MYTISDKDLRGESISEYKGRKLAEEAFRQHIRRLFIKMDEELVHQTEIKDSEGHTLDEACKRNRCRFGTNTIRLIHTNKYGEEIDSDGNTRGNSEMLMAREINRIAGW